MPYCIVTYDVGEERVNRVRKILKRYFTWVQNSVFEGEIRAGKLEKCLQEIKKRSMAMPTRYMYIALSSSIPVKSVLSAMRKNEC